MADRVKGWGEGWGGTGRGGEGEQGKGWRREGGKVKEGMGGTGQDMGCDEGRERKKGRKMEERGYRPQTSIPAAVTADLDPPFRTSWIRPWDILKGD